jgi:ketosteroid isomerase-like protein
MSQENVEFVEGLFGGATSMDKQELLAALPALIAHTCAEDIEWIEDPRPADGTIHRGHAGVRESWEAWLEQWDNWEGEIEQTLDCGDDVLVIAHERARGPASGASVSSRNYMIFTIRAGKIARYREFYDEQEALTAVGLTE